MPEAFTAFLSTVRKASPPTTLAFAIATGILIFVSDPIAQTLGVDAFRKLYRGELGASFITSLALFISSSLWSVTSAVRSYIGRRTELQRGRDQQRRNREARQQDLHRLTADEKAYISPYITGGLTTQNFLITDGIACGLCARNILHRPSSVGSMLGGFAHNLQPWAREYLEEHPELLQGATRGLPRRPEFEPY